MTLTLGFHYHVPARQINGQIYTPGFQGRFLDSLASQCRELICFLHSPLAGEEAIMDYRLASPNVSLVDIGPHLSVPRRLLGRKRFVQQLRNNRQRLDALLLRGPSPLLPAMAHAANKVPLVFLLVGDYLDGVEDLPQPAWRKLGIRLWAGFNRWQQHRIARRSLTFVNSRVLYDNLRARVPDLFETRTTTLTEADFFYREDTCGSPPYHLLYTGRMDRNKGLMEMVEALAILVSRGEDLVLDLVGWPEKNDNILEELLAQTQERGIEGRLKYHGYKAVGPELFAYYRQADIYVLASKAAEGFPRTIWEALAHSLPVVATRVGSIPSFLPQAAELVIPGDARELAEGIRRLIHGPEVRRRLIGEGIKLARENTLEFRVEEMVSRIKDWVKNQP